MDISIAPEITAAFADGRAVVALESTVISHGLPYPQNLETALKCDAAVRAAGAVPATIAILEGEICVGLDGKQIETLATSESVRKVSLRDLSVVCGKRLDGATTVAATSWIANRAGIPIFSTGGIGGVHRGDQRDVSADLMELARTPITVVCSGPKIVLDLPATREWLETSGVTLLGWQCDEMPAFYGSSSGLPVDERVGSAEEAVEIIKARDTLGLTTAVLVTVPPPRAQAMPRQEVEDILNASIAEADASGIGGKDLTPFLLSQMAERSGGRTLDANIALLENNARVAAEIATAISAPSSA
jgi:pseudouridylate synthase